VGATHLVTASALLDLVSERWLSRLADACASSGCAALFALTYDGTIDWGTDAHPVDALVRRAVNEHQRRDKGLGPALGPDAASTAADIFRSRATGPGSRPVRGCSARTTARSPGRSSTAGRRRRSEQRPADAADLARWAERRREAVASSSFALTVGHQDLLALPPGSSADPP
jgi:hypothetical protein